MKDTGIDFISTERRRQLEKLGFDEAHDQQWSKGEIALAAACYATPVPLFSKRVEGGALVFQDPWPWGKSFDKRRLADCRAVNDQDFRFLPHPAQIDPADRLRLLIKAGALIAAEIDRQLKLPSEKSPLSHLVKINGE